ncbi:MAG: hypothetical protein GTO18_13125 [Anaerolineales bacterium]|nr:hypothetical protein [Anaerolineales bacterium]
MKTVIVVPTIRENCISDFINAWGDEFEDEELIVVEDNPSRTFDLSAHSNITHYSWEDIDNDLSDQSWIIPRRTDCVRSYGYYKAFLRSPSMIVTLDDDCYPLEGNGKGFLSTHWDRLNGQGTGEAWRMTANDAATRGVPYYNVERTWPVAINHGMWSGVPDYDAPTQLVRSRNPSEFSYTNQTIPVGKYFPMCGMNVAFLPEVVPAFYFMLMGKDYAYDRFGDIWAGIVIKKICDHLGFAITSGDPAVSHQRASNVWSNLHKEVAALEVNEIFWQAVDNVVLTEDSIIGCYKEIAEKLELEGEYWEKLREAMRAWAELFN